MRIALARKALALLAVAASLTALVPASALAQSAAADEADPNGEPAPEDGAVEGRPADAPVDPDEYADVDPSALTDFREALDPHGAWVDDPVYGTVWVPSADEVSGDFTPYLTGGHWAYDVDYVWVSDFAWGWVAFHYGRWVRLDSGLWVWVAGRRYAGAWVDWRIGDDPTQVVGWAPAPPRWAWHGGLPFANPARPHPAYVYCPRADVFSPLLRAHVVASGAAAALAARTRAYVPARPSVVARQSLPSVGAAATGVSSPVLRGPPPASLGIAVDRVVAVNPLDPSVARARAFSRGTTAAAFGARPPMPSLARIARPWVAQPAPRPRAPAPAPNRRR